MGYNTNTDIYCYIVEAVCGHVGREYAVIKNFAIMACSSKEAAAVCREIPRVKHHFKYAIRSVRRVTFEEYLIQRLKNAFDPYLNSSNIQEQNSVMDHIDLVSMEDLGKTDGYKKKTKVSHKKYINNYLADFSIPRDYGFAC